MEISTDNKEQKTMKTIRERTEKFFIISNKFIK